MADNPREERHFKKVKKLREEYLRSHGNVVLNKKISHLFRNPEKSQHKLDVSGFNEVISVENGIADVEGMITMEEIVKATLEKGFVPQVTIELKNITAGGAVSGIAIEASSFKYGLFHESVEEMEILIPTGEVITCSSNKNSDLFYAMPNSYGTLGYILRLKIRLIKAKKYVHLVYTKYDDAKKCFDDLDRLSASNRPHNFVEGVVFNRKSAVVSVGTFVDNAPYADDYTYIKAYYKSLRHRNEDYLTTQDFLFRWDPDIWWSTKGSPLENIFIRFFVGKWLLNSKRERKVFEFIDRHFGKLHHLVDNKSRENVIQDIGIAKPYWGKYLDFLLDEIGILPIWLCPFRGTPDFKLFPLEDKTYIDFGFWNSLPAKEDRHYWNRLVEKKTFECKGVKSLYSEVTYTEDEFWKNTDKKEYEQVKKKYDPQGKLKGLYEKVVDKSTK